MPLPTPSPASSGCAQCADDYCRHSLRAITVNGQDRGAYFEKTPYRGANETTLHISRLFISKAEANGTRICFVLGGECPSLDSFCFGGRCRYALGSTPSATRCCPVGGFTPPWPAGSGDKAEDDKPGSGRRRQLQLLQARTRHDDPQEQSLQQGSRSLSM